MALAPDDVPQGPLAWMDTGFEATRFLEERLRVKCLVIHPLTR